MFLKKWIRKILLWALGDNVKVVDAATSTTPPKPPIENLEVRDKQIRDLSDTNDEVTEKKVCPSCRLNTDHLVTCGKCGSVGCEECFTYDPSTKQYYCDNCW